jgi:hypothetical protein
MQAQLMTATAGCPASVHTAMKAHRALYIIVTRFIGWQPQVDDAPLELRVCCACGSTLADGTVRDDGGFVRVAPRVRR